MEAYMQLTAGMFGQEFGPHTETPFKLRTGQMCCSGKITHNSGWYSAAGDKLGWGDLGGNDFHRIKARLEPGQVFVVLSESDSFWDFPQRQDKYGTTIERPGRQYVIDHAAFVITPTEFYWVDKFGYERKASLDFGSLTCKVLKCEQVAQVIP